SFVPEAVAELKVEDVMLPDSLPPFDLQAALKRLNGNKRLLYNLLIKFYDTYANLIPNLNAMMERGEYKNAQHLAHTFKGGASSLEAVEIFDIARRLEQALMHNSIEEAHALIVNLDAALASAIAAVLLIKAKPRSQVPSVAEHVEEGGNGQASLPFLIEELDTLLLKRSMNTRAKFNEFQKIIAQQSESRHLEDMAAAIEKLDFAQARISLAALAKNIAVCSERQV
ncbi:MAG: Hpt domain-containing protein, partial [Alteromonadales bacterium]|nr:Hpt domain-containing protein [Alteromonadales bacterium]